MQTCRDCIWFMEQKETIINYCIMKQSHNEFPDKENDCLYFASKNKQ